MIKVLEEVCNVNNKFNALLPISVELPLLILLNAILIIIVVIEMDIINTSENKLYYIIGISVIVVSLFITWGIKMYNYYQCTRAITNYNRQPPMQQASMQVPYSEYNTGYVGPTYNGVDEQDTTSVRGAGEKFSDRFKKNNDVISDNLLPVF